jgi:hypothetical protein
MLQPVTRTELRYKNVIATILYSWLMFFPPTNRTIGMIDLFIAIFRKKIWKKHNKLELMLIFVVWLGGCTNKVYFLEEADGTNFTVTDSLECQAAPRSVDIAKVKMVYPVAGSSQKFVEEGFDRFSQRILRLVEAYDEDAGAQLLAEVQIDPPLRVVGVVERKNKVLIAVLNMSEEDQLKLNWLDIQGRIVGQAAFPQLPGAEIMQAQFGDRGVMVMLNFLSDHDHIKSMLLRAAYPGVDHVGAVKSSEIDRNTNVERFDYFAPSRFAKDSNFRAIKRESTRTSLVSINATGKISEEIVFSKELAATELKPVFVRLGPSPIYIISQGSVSFETLSYYIYPENVKQPQKLVGLGMIDREAKFFYYRDKNYGLGLKSNREFTGLFLFEVRGSKAGPIKSWSLAQGQPDLQGVYANRGDSKKMATIVLRKQHRHGFEFLYCSI